MLSRGWAALLATSYSGPVTVLRALERTRLPPALAEMLGTEHSLSGKEEAGHVGGGSVIDLVTQGLELNFLSAPGVKENLPVLFF